MDKLMDADELAIFLIELDLLTDFDCKELRHKTLKTTDVSLFCIKDEED